MKSIAKFLVTGGAIALSGTVLAQQNNNVPMSDPSSPQYNTVYMPNVVNGAQPAQPQERWEDRWGAFAYATNGASGGVQDKVSKRQADKAALALCKAEGGNDCRVSLSYYNQCGAVSSGGGKIASGHAPTEREAVELAIAQCEEDSGSNCELYFMGCSLPVRAR